MTPLRSLLILLFALPLLTCGGPVASQGGPDGASADCMPIPDTGRLMPLTWQGNDGTRVSSPWFYDSKLKERCTLQIATDPRGVIYCVPIGQRPDPTQHVCFKLAP